MLVGGDHEVAGCVRVQVQNDEVAGATMDYKILPITYFRGFDAENTPRRAAGLSNVLVSPGTPQTIHQDVCTGSVDSRPGAGAAAAALLTMSFNSLLGLK